MFEMRGGEEQLAFDPGAAAGDGRVVFIGTIRSPWITRAECPKNMGAAREQARPATVEIDAPYRPGLRGIEGLTHVFLLTWLHHAPRNLIVQKPRHAVEAKGTFALRSPARPNPIGLHLVGLTAFDIASGILTLDAIDVLDGTPLIDIKPYFPSVDIAPAVSLPQVS